MSGHPMMVMLKGCGVAILATMAMKMMMSTKSSNGNTVVENTLFNDGKVGDNSNKDMEVMVATKAT